MLEILLPLVLVSGCDSGSAGQFSVCATEQQQSQIPSSQAEVTPRATPLRLCSYYVNGSIDQPTIGIITAWVEAGSRLCIGDQISETSVKTVVRTIADDLSDRFTALSERPFAWWEPGGAVEFEDPATFYVSQNDLVVVGNLLGRTAQIRFRPVSARWTFSDGQRGSGFAFTTSFAEVGSYQAIAHVKYEVDYLLSGGTWELSAAAWELTSQTMSIPVVEFPRRTLLVG